jgi:hypothetical protein
MEHSDFSTMQCNILYKGDWLYYMTIACILDQRCPTFHSFMHLSFSLCNTFISSLVEFFLSSLSLSFMSNHNPFLTEPSKSLDFLPSSGILFFLNYFITLAFYIPRDKEITKRIGDGYLILSPHVHISKRRRIQRG